MDKKLRWEMPCQPIPSETYDELANLSDVVLQIATFPP